MINALTHRVWRLWAFIIVLAGVAFALRLWNAATLDNPLKGSSLLADVVIWLILIPLAAPAYTTVGAIILARQPANRIAWLCLMLGTLLTLEDIAWQYTLRARAEQWPFTMPVALIGMWLTILNFPPLPFTLLLLHFPAGRMLSPRWQWVGWLAAAAVVLQIISVTFLPRWYPEVAYPLSNPLGQDSFIRELQTTGKIGFALAMLAMLAALISLPIRHRRSNSLNRQQLKWFALIGGALPIVILLAAALWMADQNIALVFYASAVAILSLGIPAAIAIALLRYRLYDIDLVINRTLVYGVLTAMLVVIYSASVLLLQTLFHLMTGGLSDVAVMSSSLLTAVLFTPLRRRVQEVIDRRFYRQRYDIAQVLTAFSTAAREEVDLQQIRERLLNVVADTMQPTHLSLWLRDPAQDRDE